jgi:hypothetical protein
MTSCEVWPVAAVIARVPDDVIGLPLTVSHDGTVCATLVTPPLVPLKVHVVDEQVTPGPVNVKAPATVLMLVTPPDTDGTVYVPLALR